MVKVFEFVAKIKVRYEGPGPFPSHERIRRWLLESMEPSSRVSIPMKLAKVERGMLASNDVSFCLTVKKTRKKS